MPPRRRFWLTGWHKKPHSHINRLYVVQKTNEFSTETHFITDTLRNATTILHFDAILACQLLVLSTVFWYCPILELNGHRYHFRHRMSSGEAEHLIVNSVQCTKDRFRWWCLKPSIRWQSGPFSSVLRCSVGGNVGTVLRAYPKVHAAPVKTPERAELQLCMGTHATHYQ